MQTQVKEVGTECGDREMNEELAGVLTAISVVSKRLAQKMTMLAAAEKQKTEGEKADEQKE